MRNRFIGSILVVVAVALSSVGLGQVAAQSVAPKAIPDLAGIWDSGACNPRNGGLGPDGVPSCGFAKEEPPMQPWAAE